MSGTDEVAESTEESEEETPSGGRGFPSPLTILVLVLIGVWALALVLPSGQYQHDETGAPIPGAPPRRTAARSTATCAVEGPL